MKKISVFIVFVLLAGAVCAQRDLKYKWSATVEYGLSNLDGDGDSYIKQAFGTSVEYAFLPFAGIALDYYYFPLGGPTFTTNVNAASVNLTVNVNRLFFSDTDYKVILKGSIGYGIAGYTSTYISSTTPSQTSVSNSASSFPVLSVSVEYYLTKLFSVGAKSQFRPFNVNNLEGDPRYNLDNVYNDNIVGATLYLRFKFSNPD